MMKISGKMYKFAPCVCAASYNVHHMSDKQNYTDRIISYNLFGTAWMHTLKEK